MTTLPMAVQLDDLRRFAVARSLFPKTGLAGALDALGFVQADPIRAPARAQDLILAQRVDGYRAGDLERLYGRLGIEEGFFINYGFLTRRIYGLMQPRAISRPRPAGRRNRAAAILEFVRERGTVHPRDVDGHFQHGTVTNYWGGSSNATTHLLDLLHYRGLLRIVRREAGVRVYGVQDPFPPPADRVERARRLDALVDVVVRKYAPLPSASLSAVINRLRYAVPQWTGEIEPARRRAKARLARAHVNGTDWFWPADEQPAQEPPPDRIRLLAPFDPVVWDRRRFELFWGWAYRFEAYTPVKKRKLGYYALPLVWRDRVIGWANASVRNGKLDVAFGYVSGRPPRDRGYRQALEQEVSALRTMLGLPSSDPFDP